MLVKIAQFNKGSPMKSSRLGTCLLLAFSIVAASYAEAAATCVDAASPSTLVFEGILRHKIFAGPPEFEDVRKGDTPEPTYILELDEPACARNDEFIDPVTRFKTIHLTYDQTISEGKRLKEQLRQLTGQHVVVKGKSGEGAVTGHHHAPFLVEIATIEADRDGMPDFTTPEKTTVQAFYYALEAGNGEEASRFVVPQKRQSGPLSARALTQYYNTLAEPLKLISIRPLGNGDFEVRYTFRAPQKAACNGRAVVTIVKDGDLNLIQGIRSLTGC